MTAKSKDEKKEILTHIEANRAQGMSLEKACKAAGTTWSSYYKYQEDLGIKSKRAKVRVTKTRTVKKPSVLTFEVPAPKEVPMMLIWGMPKDIFAALDRVSR